MLILISSLYLFRSPVRVAELIPIRRYLYTYWYLYLSQISRRSSHNLCLYIGTLRYYRTYTCTSYLILVLRSISLSYGYYTCIIELILIFQILYLYYGSYTCITDLIFVFQNLFLCYRTYSCITDTEVPVGTTEQIERYP